MLRLRFSSGLILGLLLGVPAGTLIGLLVLPPRAAEPTAANTLQVEELTRKLEIAREENEHVDRQLDQFTKLADQMTASFNNLEHRFKALEAAPTLHEVHNQQPPPSPTAQAPPPPTAASAATEPAGPTPAPANADAPAAAE
jgi:hypothetical protein